MGFSGVLTEKLQTWEWRYTATLVVGKYKSQIGAVGGMQSKDPAAVCPSDNFRLRDLGGA